MRLGLSCMRFQFFFQLLKLDGFAFADLGPIQLLDLTLIYVDFLFVLNCEFFLLLILLDLVEDQVSERVALLIIQGRKLFSLFLLFGLSLSHLDTRHIRERSLVKQQLKICRPRGRFDLFSSHSLETLQVGFHLQSLLLALSIDFGLHDVFLEPVHSVVFLDGLLDRTGRHNRIHHGPFYFKLLFRLGQVGGNKLALVLLIKLNKQRLFLPDFIDEPV